MASIGIGTVRLVGGLTVLLLKAVQSAQESNNCSLDTQMIPFPAGAYVWENKGRSAYNCRVKELSTDSASHRLSAQTQVGPCSVSAQPWAST